MKKLALYSFFIALPVIIAVNVPLTIWAATYYIPTSTTTVDGRSYCAEKACQGGDKLIIRGGSREGLLLQNFDGKGSYITVTNENVNPDRRVVLDQGSSVGYAILSLSNCKWLDLRGNNDPDLQYGIKVNNGVEDRSAAIHVYGESHHIKIGYTEVSFDGNRGTAGCGIRVQDASLSNAWIFDTFEIHHNYIHDVKYAGMYLGHNDPHSLNDPYTRNFSIHDNIVKKSGGYGLNLKGAKGGTSYIYNNLVDTTGLLRDKTTYTDHWRAGIRPNMPYDGAVINVYENTIMNTVGACIDSSFNGTGYGKESAIVNIYDNELLNCGIGEDERFGHGIVTHFGTRAYARNNIILQSHGYGIWVRSTTVLFRSEHNLGGEAKNGATLSIEYEKESLYEEVSPNVYHASVDDFNFVQWSNDGNYYNDILSLEGDSEGIQVAVPQGFKAL